VSTSKRIARVVLETRLPQLDRLFDYAVPEDMVLEPGVRVKVPLRSQTKSSHGFVVEISESSDHKGTLAPISEVVSPIPVLSEELWRLARLVADRQVGNAADVLRLAIPPRYVRVEKKWAESQLSEPPRTIEIELPETEDFPSSSLDEIVAPGARTVLGVPGGVISDTHGAPMPKEVQVVSALVARALRLGKSVVVVVPDWRDRQVYTTAFSKWLPEGSLVLWHSDMPAGERYREFLRTLEHRPLVVLGNRHAVYAPVYSLGLMVVVDDADEAHREPLAPYPHTRDVALLRHQESGCALVFAGLVPSLTSLRLTRMGYFRNVAAPRVDRPRVIPTGLATVPEHSMSPARLPSVAFQAAKKASSEGPVLVQVFRTGYSPGLACATCKERGACQNCHGPLRLARPGSPPHCAWCGLVHTRWQCAACASTALVPKGSGIGRTMSDLGKAFPGVPVIQADGDHPVLSVPDKPALVVATRGAEPYAVGGYRAALLLDGQAMLSRESLGTLEDTLRSWERAIALVRHDGPVFVTEVDGSPALAVASGQYDLHLGHELSQRDMVRLPPTLRIASVTGPALAVAVIRDRIAALAPTIDVLGPVPFEEGTTRTIIRFPYSLGDQVQKELRAAQLKALSGQGRNARDRIRIVMDNPQSLDVLAGE